MKVNIAALDKMTDALLAYGPSKKNAAKPAKSQKKKKRRKPKSSP
ncbi:MAG TPA: hypothetical protein VIJ62_12765 [Rhizomicrobium sp.]